MASHIENYALIGNLRGSGLVSRDGSIDWLCVPRFDSAACFAALLGRDEHGCWLIDPAAHVKQTRRRYRPGTIILETDFECDGGAMRIIDFMPAAGDSVIRIVEGLEGSVAVDLLLRVRFGYGGYRPWITKVDGDIVMTVAPSSMVLRTRTPLECDDKDVRALFTVRQGKRCHRAHLVSRHAQRVPPLVLVLAALIGRTNTSTARPS